MEGTAATQYLGRESGASDRMGLFWERTMYFFERRRCASRRSNPTIATTVVISKASQDVTQSTKAVVSLSGDRKEQEAHQTPTFTAIVPNNKERPYCA